MQFHFPWVSFFFFSYLQYVTSQRNSEMHSNLLCFIFWSFLLLHVIGAKLPPPFIPAFLLKSYFVSLYNSQQMIPVLFGILSLACYCKIARKPISVNILIESVGCYEYSCSGSISHDKLVGIYFLFLGIFFKLLDNYQMQRIWNFPMDLVNSCRPLYCTMQKCLSLSKISQKVIYTVL